MTFHRCHTLCIFATLLLLAASNPIPTSIIPQTDEVIEYVTEIDFEVVTESTIEDVITQETAQRNASTTAQPSSQESESRESESHESRESEEVRENNPIELLLTTERVAEAIQEEDEIITTQLPGEESESQEESSKESSMEREQDIQTTGQGNMEAVTEISEDEQTEIVTEIVTVDLLPESDRTAAPERVIGTVAITQAPSVQATSARQSQRDATTDRFVPQTATQTPPVQVTSAPKQTVTPPQSQRDATTTRRFAQRTTTAPSLATELTDNEAIQTEIIEVTELVDVTDDNYYTTGSTERMPLVEETTTATMDNTQNATTAAITPEIKPATERPSHSDTGGTGVIIDIIVDGQAQASGPGYDTNGDTGDLQPENGHHVTYDVGTGLNGHVQVYVHIDQSPIQQ